MSRISDSNITMPSRKSRLSKPYLFHTEDIPVDGGHNNLTAPKTEQQKREGLASRLSKDSSTKQIEKLLGRESIISNGNSKTEK